MSDEILDNPIRDALIHDVMDAVEKVMLFDATFKVNPGETFADLFSTPFLVVAKKLENASLEARIDVFEKLTKSAHCACEGNMQNLLEGGYEKETAGA